VGLDCVGLAIWPVMKYGMDVDIPAANYTKIPDPARMQQLIDERMDVVHGDPQPGDVLWIAFREIAYHVAILTDQRTIIHACEHIRSRVIEHGYRPPWTNRVIRVWSYKGIGSWQP